MEKIDILLWIVGGGFAVTFSMLKIMFNKIEKLDEKITDIDRRLCRIEGAMAAKDCCMLKSDQQIRKAE